MDKNYRVNIEVAKKKYAQIRELYEVLSNCASLEIDGSSPLEQREPTLADYQNSEYVVERVIYRDRRHPLPTVLINNFNEKTGSDMGEVQIVYGPGANEYARSRHALALAVLDTIYFRSGAYRPETEEGRKTIAHELTHVAQHKNRPLADNRTKAELEAEAEDAESTGDADNAKDCKNVHGSSSFALVRHQLPVSETPFFYALYMHLKTVDLKSELKTFMETGSVSESLRGTWYEQIFNNLHVA